MLTTRCRLSDVINRSRSGNTASVHPNSPRESVARDYNKIANTNIASLLCESVIVRNKNSEMPTDVMSATCRSEHFGQGFGRKNNDAEIKSGFLVLLGPGGMRQDVRVVVYRTSLEHFAVIYPRKRLSKPIGVVNLRNTAVERAEASNGFVVRQKGYDNTISAKFLCAERDVESWLSAFESLSSACNHHASLPVLVEGEES